MRRHLATSLVLVGLITASARADTPRAPGPPPATAKSQAAVSFPAVGTKLTYTSAAFEDTWTTTLRRVGPLLQFVPHEDTINYFTKAGFGIADDGIYIVGETIADLGGSPPAPARALAFPLKQGATGTVPGFIRTTYKVGARKPLKVPAGTFRAWKITVTDPHNKPGAVWIAPEVGIVKIQLPTGRVDELVKIEPPAP
ncbi:MAG: hypothetical protein M3680_06555 [Myxococcota bacterium]|nr:hypothetical protein [Myxococcota bacterium]